MSVPLLVSLFILQYCALVLAQCPNDCYMRGICTNDNACECESSYTLPDCSGCKHHYTLLHNIYIESVPALQLSSFDLFIFFIFIFVFVVKCPTFDAWVGKAYAENEARTAVECSHKGVCDRSTGQCECYEGYEGHACQRMACTNGCSGHGACNSIGSIYDKFTSVQRMSGNYTSWEATRASGCVCDAGYTGAACEMKLCPKGDDPLTPYQEPFRLQSMLTLGVTVEVSN